MSSHPVGLYKIDPNIKRNYGQFHFDLKAYFIKTKISS